MAGPGIVIIGAGFSGIGMGMGLRRAGYRDFVVLEQAGDLGGTWRDNTYPGCACDVPSHLYSYSSALEPGWPRLFSRQPDIWAYLRRCADRHGVTPHIRYGARVVSLEYDERRGGWEVTTADGEVLRPRAVVSAVGALRVPSIPDLPGARTFAGPAFHSSRWDHGVDLTGRRVAVIGTGASAVQFVPRIAPRVARLTVFQRTPPWIRPRPDLALPPLARRALRLPGAARTLRDVLYWLLEARALGFTVHPRLMAAHERAARAHLRAQVPDPELRDRLTPDYTIGCKRVLVSSDYYPALTRPNVELVASPAAGIRPRAVVDATGREHEAHVIVYGTGFRVTDALREQRIVGRDGVELQDAWREGIEAYYGITTAGFPNLFFLLGPNTGLGHNSIVFMIESQVRYVLDCLRLLSRTGARALDVRPERQRAFNRRLLARLDPLVWNAGGCRSWYLDEHGVNRTMWPGFSFEYWARTLKANPRAYELIR
ncbi:flavin-containing monooxygenase [Nonomuraea roseoviolacea]|uniref:Cation diffusion facilitator CzcD-associated flavoprotein CzcO n=1 Tax=Nonomuraea roseoviolacea subsp. carminata TaxID=160689 RepID=A0ABT1JVC3_9ACTN|nr:NAD(P)/FAD-dependent oxidoreductase [Nonomuraea roseoviolacea]MCP2345706.1 cation diffusion facilitator CzcD-associated flavoprotein CzcO [Nonomuraea roseoviolacea subsp. carminata]